MKTSAYSLYKLRCQTPGCGYKYQQPRAYYCDTDIGCLTHNRTQQYTVTIQCWDGYNSTDVEDFTFRVVKNAVPAYRHLPSKSDNLVKTFVTSFLFYSHTTFFNEIFV
jgi:hypothetical protein